MRLIASCRQSSRSPGNSLYQPVTEFFRNGLVLSGRSADSYSVMELKTSLQPDIEEQIISLLKREHLFDPPASVVAMVLDLPRHPLLEETA